MKPHIRTDTLRAECLGAFVPNTAAFERPVQTDHFNSLYGPAIYCQRNLSLPPVVLSSDRFDAAAGATATERDANTAAGV